MRNTRRCLIEGRDDCQQLKPNGVPLLLLLTVIALTILLLLSILFGRATVKVLVFVLRAVFFHCIFLCNAVHVRCSASGFALSASFASEFNSVLMAVR